MNKLLRLSFLRQVLPQARKVQAYSFFLAASWLLPVGLVQAQSTQLVKDIAPPGTPMTYLEQTVNVNGTLYFSPNDGVHGNELWKTDGTEVGTVLIKDIFPGENGSSILNFIQVSTSAFFVADDGVHGTELWKTDGTAAGTVLVKDINVGGESYPEYLTNVNGSLYFQADDGIHGIELWKSDGTAAGTVLVKDINASAVQYGSNPEYLTNVNGTLFFAASDGIHGYELWKSNGTEAGTVMVKDIYTEGFYNSSIPSKLTNVNGVLFFSVDEGADGIGTTLWKSDGTEAGTVEVEDFIPESANGPSYLGYLTNVNGVLYFTANTMNSATIELWKSDGTDAGTVKVKSLYPVSDDGIRSLTNLNGSLYFKEEDQAHKVKIWKSDGTESGTVLIKEIDPGSSGSFTYPIDLASVDGTLYFSANDGVNGLELWKSDGTGSGTIMVKDINPLSESSSPSPVTNVNGTIYFWANDGVHGRELWKSSPSSVPRVDQVITFNALPTKTYGDTTFALTATASSGLGVLYTSSNAAVATINGKWVTITGVGTTTITAVQAGDASYNAAPPVSQTLSVNKATQQVSFPLIGSKYSNDAPFALQASASSGLAITYSIIYGPATLAGSTLTITGAGEVKVKATQAGDANYFSASQEQTFTVVLATGCQVSGTILRESWINAKGYDVRQIPINTAPVTTSQLTKFEGPSNVTNEYGDRIRGYLCISTSGYYTFWIASDDNSALYLSLDSQPFSKRRIAWVNGATKPKEWIKYASQQSAPIYLEAGHKYYIESLHKEAYGDDHIAVGWQLPNGTLERPISGANLSPFVAPANARLADLQDELEAELASLASLSAYPNPFADQTSIRFTAEVSGKASISVYDLSGSLVKGLFEGELEAGVTKELTLDGATLPSGVYLVKATSPAGVSHLKLVLTK